MTYRNVIGVILIVFSFLIFPSEALASVETLPSGIKDSEIGKVIEDYIEEHKDTTAAVSIGIFRGEETIYKTAYGYANIEDQLKADDETVYEWGSTSKLLTWVSVMQLWEEGKIDFQVDVKEYLPEGFFTKLKYDNPITMINLMNHNAGFEDIVFEMCADNESGILSLEDALKVTEPNQVYEPGRVSAYSNWSTSLAGYIVERISGQAFYEYVQEHIFQPLNMNRTGLDPIYSDNPWVKSKLLEAEGYTYNLMPMEGGLFYLNLYPAGSTAGTLDDIIKFAKALLPNSDGSEKLFKKKETLTKMLSPTLKYPASEVDYINHGLWSHEYNVQALGHGGNTSMYSTYLIFDPVSCVGTVIMTNQASECTYNYGIPPMIYGELGAMVFEDGRSNTREISGLYYSARTTRSGIAKMYTLINLQPYSVDEDGNLSSSLPGMLERYGKQIAPNSFVLTMQSGLYKVDHLARYANNHGVKTLSSVYGQTMQADGDIWACAIATILLIIAVFWSVFILLVNIIRFVIQKIKGCESIEDSFKKYEVILCSGILLLVVNILSVGNKMMSSAPYSSLMVNIIASIILALVPIGCAVQLYRKWPYLTSAKLQKLSYIISMCMGCVVTFTVMVLEMYKL